MASKKADFDTFYRQEAQKFYATAYRMTQNHQDALDIVQETFLHGYRGWERFEGNAKATTWLYRILLNLCYDLLRKRSRERRVELPGEIEHPGEVYDGEHSVRVSETAARIREVVAELTLKQRTVFVLKTYQELPYKEIAELTRSRIGTVKATYFQAVQKVRRKLKERGVIRHEL